MAYTTPQLLAMSQEALDNLFSDSPSGDIPNGEAQGTAIIAPGTKYTSEIASLINIFGWQGKTFGATDSGFWDYAQARAGSLGLSILASVPPKAKSRTREPTMKSWG